MWKSNKVADETISATVCRTEKGQNGCKTDSKSKSNSSSGEYARPGQLSYLSVPGEKPLLGITVGQLVDQAAAKYQNVEAIIDNSSGNRKTFQQIKQNADELAGGFLKLGLKQGDRIGVWGPNSFEWYLTMMGAIKAGLVLVNINQSYKSNEVLYCINAVKIKCLVLGEPFKSQNYYEMLSNVVPEMMASEPGQIKSSQAPTLTHVINMVGNESQGGTFTFKEIIELGKTADMKQELETATRRVQFDDVCNIQFTSGTTGNAKGVMLSHHNIVNDSFLIGKRASYSQKDKICVPVPFFHCYGCVIGILCGLHYGATIVLPGPGFNPQTTIEIVSKEKCTVIYGTPTMYIDMLNIPGFDKYDLSSLRMAVTAGSVCPEELIKKMRRKYTVDAIVSIYGMTESSPAFCQSLPDDTDTQRAVTVGYPFEHVEVKIVDKTGQLLNVGTGGEICVRGFVTMQGYFERPDLTAEVLKSSKWLHTGDLGVMLDTGHIKIVGRIKDIIIRGGENIYPTEIEDFLLTNPKIQEAQVFGVPDERLGEQVATWIHLKKGQVSTPEEITEFCNGQISYYKVPKHIIFTDTFPKTTSGKIQKSKMREETISKLGLGK